MKTWRTTVNKYSEPKKFAYLWNMLQAGNASIGYWIGNIYMFEGMGQLEYSIAE